MGIPLGIPVCGPILRSGYKMSNSTQLEVRAIVVPVRATLLRRLLLVSRGLSLSRPITIWQTTNLRLLCYSSVLGLAVLAIATVPPKKPGLAPNGTRVVSR